MATNPQWLIELGEFLPVPKERFQQIIVELQDAGIDFSRFKHEVMGELIEPQNAILKLLLQPMSSSHMSDVALRELTVLHRGAAAGRLQSAEVERLLEEMCKLLSACRTPVTLMEYISTRVLEQTKGDIRSTLAKLLMAMLQEKKRKLPAPASV